MRLFISLKLVTYCYNSMLLFIFFFSSKIQQAAAATNQLPREFCNTVSHKFKVCI